MRAAKSEDGIFDFEEKSNFSATMVSLFVSIWE